MKIRSSRRRNKFCAEQFEFGFGSEPGVYADTLSSNGSEAAEKGLNSPIISDAIAVSEEPLP